MKALNKRIKFTLATFCWAVVILVICQVTATESFGQAVSPLTIKVETDGKQVRLTSNNYSRCQWTSSAPDIIFINPASGQTTTGTALASSPYTWIVITCECTSKVSGETTQLSECLEFTVQKTSLGISQGYSGMSRGKSGTCQYGSSQ